MKPLIAGLVGVLVSVGVQVAEGAVVGPGEAGLIVSLSDGSVLLAGNDVGLTGYEAASRTCSLIPDATRDPSPFSGYLANRVDDVCAVVIPAMPTVNFPPGGRLVPLNWTFDITGARDIRFKYGIRADVGSGVFDGPVEYVADPPEPDLPPVLGYHALDRPGGSTATGAVIMVHGWEDSPSLFSYDSSPQATNMKAHIEDVLGGDAQWDVLTYDWQEHAAKTAEELGDLLPSERVKAAAFTHGLHLAQEIREKGYDSNVHLIAHGLGGMVIDTAARLLRSYSQWNGTIHTTFLDAYTPTGWESFFGLDADWADHYYYDESAWPDTQADFRHAHNVDVTALLDEPGTPSENHKWPVRWYDRTVTGDDPENAGYGFPLSKESPLFAGDWPAGLPIGQTVTLPLDGEPRWAPRVAVSNLHPVDPAEDLLGTSDSGTVEVSAGQLNLGTGSPVWSNLDLSSENVTNFLEFDFEFTSDADGVLSVYLDGQLLGLFHERFVLAGQQTSGKLFFDEPLEEGFHVLGFRLDPLDDDTSWIMVSGIEAGNLTVVPEPGTLWLLLVAGLCLCGGRRSLGLR